MSCSRTETVFPAELAALPRLRARLLEELQWLESGGAAARVRELAVALEAD